MKTSKGGWIARVILGAALGVLSSVVLASYLAESRGPTLAVSLLCAGLGGVLSAATLPFADDGRSLLLHSAVHFEATALLFGLLMAQLGARGAELLAWEAILFLLYAVVWLGRWIGWYVEVMQLRTMLGLAPGPSPLKWRETLPYLAFALLLCDVLPMLLFWADHAVSADVPVLSGLLLPYLLLPVAGFSSGMSMGKRQGVCPLYPAACFVCYLPMVFLLFNYTAMFHCFMVAVPALAGNVTGWLYRRAASKKKS